PVQVVARRSYHRSVAYLLSSRNMTNSTIIRAKCVVLGEATAGKTALIQSFLTDGAGFPKNYTMTLGLDVQTKIINVPDSNTAVELYFFDCSGREFYRDMVMKMCDQPSLIFLVYDITSETSFKAIESFYEQVKEQAGNEKLKGILYGNKTDLTTRRLVSPKAGRELAAKLGLMYFEGTAKDNSGVEEPFFFMVNEWFKTYTDKTQAFKILT
ncbi:unnamed protein product, partial [Meganyctiphanes norvegica]